MKHLKLQDSIKDNTLSCLLMLLKSSYMVVSCPKPSDKTWLHKSYLLFQHVLMRCKITEISNKNSDFTSEFKLQVFSGTIP